jgi:hypothetical protein
MKTVGISLTVFEFQRIQRNNFASDFKSTLGIEQLIETHARAQPVVVVAFRANTLIAFQVRTVEDGFTSWTLRP